MRVEELSFVEESDSLLIFFGIHGSFWHSAQGYVARGHSKLCLYELAMSLRIGYVSTNWLSPEDPVVRTGSHEKQQRYR
jgi:hypothetical protein